MKPDTFLGYPSDSLLLPEQVLLTAWDCLTRFHDDLVLIGGLAIRYLTTAPKEGIPGPVTLDVDFGINIAASGGQYSSIRETLSSHGFVWTGQRFKRVFGKLELFIDLLTESDTYLPSTVALDDGLAVSVVPGVKRALECYRTIKVTGKTLIGSPSSHFIRVAEIGPLLVLKLNAFGGLTARKAPKDVHDILYLVMHYLDGTPKAIDRFRMEKLVENRGMASALKSLQENFYDANAQGPLSCAAFRMNNLHLDPAFAEESLQIREQCVTLAMELLR
jgi:hypothetical protein